MSPLFSLGFMNRFGRSPALRQLDTDLRALDLHPSLVPEAIKLASLKLMTARTGGSDPSAAESKAAAEILAYCMLGVDVFTTANGHIATKAVENRIDAALEDGMNLDAELILLALHANVIQPSVMARYGLESESR